MAPRHSTVEAYFDEIEANRENLTAPKDKAVFHTNRSLPEALDHARETGSVTVEGVNRDTMRPGEKLGQYGTQYGAKLEQDDLWNGYDSDTVAFNEKYGSQTAGAQRVWEKTSLVYAQQASGKVEVVTDGKEISPTGIFATVECEALLRNEKVTEINGIPRTELAKTLDDAQNRSYASESERYDAEDAAISEICARINEKNVAKLQEKEAEKHALAGKGAANSSEIGPDAEKSQILGGPEAQMANQDATDKDDAGPWAKRQRETDKARSEKSKDIERK